jgi:rhomboid protease GluP
VADHGSNGVNGSNGAPPPPPPPGPTPLRLTGNHELAESWALVLASQGIEHRLVAAEGLHALWVADADRPRAAAALAAFDRERHEQHDAEPPPVPDQGPSAAGLAFVVVIAALYWVTGPRDGRDPGGWFRHGSAIAERIVAGELERTVTALSLHADPVHLLGNAVAALIFVTALGRWLGGGLALLLTLVTGALGNLLVALAYGGGHNSVGASTATFGALGLLGGLQVMRWLRGGRTGFGRRRRVLSIIAACLGVFAMLGVGGGSNDSGARTDVLAHLAGLGVGLGLGALAGRLLPLPLRRLYSHAAGVLAGLALAGAWALALG